MKIERLIELLEEFPATANARACEGEVCGIVIEDQAGVMAIINAHECEDMYDRDYIEDTRRS